ncbi:MULTISPECIES: FG-GAP repeat domain-containing protein [Nostocales]|uniref:Integrin n=3 Tax=Nostocales TaxID=1161 RepID=A0A0C1NHE9_9CYAN|nr:VCBS repeat-containing protein [Tolypothrix bouteillei]KAF3890400.1 VCBS repeat-containing protein [Tolypothrix bouteillei VB521301]
MTESLNTTIKTNTSNTSPLNDSQNNSYVSVDSSLNQSYYGSSQSSLESDLTTDNNVSATSNTNPLLNSAAIFADFNGDGKNDKLWYNSQTGETSLWLMDGSNVLAEASLKTLTPGSTLNIADFNADNKTDLLIHNTQTGESSIWIMDGTTIVSEAALTSLSGEWSPTLVDFNADSKTDIFWRNSQTGENQAWLMDGTTITSEAALDSFDSNWTAKAGFFNGDTNTDILWRNNATGENIIWFMNGTTASASAAPTLGTEWEIASLGDVNFSIQTFETDVVWRNSATGENKIWLFDDGNVVSDTALPTLTGSGWKSSIGDFDGNGSTDLFWYNEETGENKVWIMDGATVVSDVSLQSQSPGGAWQASISDVNGDGKTDIFWRNYQTGENKLWTMDGTTYSESPVAARSPEWYTA